MIPFVGGTEISPATNTSPSLSIVWAPAHSFLLLKKHRSAVRILTQTK